MKKKNEPKFYRNTQGNKTEKMRSKELPKDETKYRKRKRKELISHFESQ